MAASMQSTFDLLKDSILSKPRMMGTPAEKETTDFLLSFLNQQGLHPFTEDFKWSTQFVTGRKYLALMGGVFIILLQLTLRLAPPLNGIATLLLALLSAACMLVFGKGLFADRWKRIGKSSTGKNVICKIDPLQAQENQPILYFTAHSDSIASNAPKINTRIMWGMIAGFLLVWIFALGSSLAGLISYDTPWPAGFLVVENFNQVGLVAAVITVALIGVNFFIRRVNTSPGAVDNGSGSAILLSLAAHFHENPPRNTRMTFVWCAAEEWGLYGSKGYVAAHRQEIAAGRDRSYVINVDMVGSELAYLDRAGIPRKPLNSRLNATIERCAAEAGIQARKFNALISGNSDHASFQKEKLEVCFFLAKKDVCLIHSPMDMIENVNPEKLADAVELIKRVVDTIDRDQARAG